MAKKLICFFLAVLACISCLVLPSFAAGDTFSYEEFTKYPTMNFIIYPYYSMDNVSPVASVFTPQEDGSLKMLAGAMTSGGAYYLYNGFVFGASDPATFTISFTTTGSLGGRVFFQYRIVRGGETLNGSVTDPVTIELLRGDNFSLWIYVGSGSTQIDCTVYPMMNYGSVAYPYQPFMNYRIENSYDEGYDDGHGVGFQEGTVAGKTEGYDEGYEAGYQDGKLDGENASTSEQYQKGYNDGFQAAMNGIEVGTVNLVDAVTVSAKVTLYDMNTDQTHIFTLENLSTQSLSVVTDVDFVYASQLLPDGDYVDDSRKVSGFDLNALSQDCENAVIDRYPDADYVDLKIEFTFKWIGVPWEYEQPIFGLKTFEGRGPAVSGASVTGVFSGTDVSTDVALNRTGVPGYTSSYGDSYYVFTPTDSIDNFTVSSATITYTDDYSIYGRQYFCFLNTVKNPSYVKGFNEGYLQGTNASFEGLGQVYFDDGYKVGFKDGRKDGLETASDGSWLSLFTAVIEAPVRAFQSLFNFEIFGFDMRNFVTSVLTICMFILILKKVGAI